jgi:hypothetical protein
MMMIGGTLTKLTRSISGMTPTPTIAGSMAIGGTARGMAGFSPAFSPAGLSLSHLMPAALRRRPCASAWAGEVDDSIYMVSLSYDADMGRMAAFGA